MPNEFIDIVFDGPPGPVCGRFVEVENSEGRSISVGEWIERADGYWVLRLDPTKEIEKRKRHIHVAGTTVGKHIDECALCGQDLRCDIHTRSQAA